MKLQGGDRAVVRTIVNRLHVSSSDDDVRTAVYMQMSKRARETQPDLVREALSYAIQEHQRSRGLHRYVMSGHHW